MSQQDPGWYYAQGDPPGTMRYWDGGQWVGEPTTQSPTYAASDRVPSLQSPTATLSAAWAGVRANVGSLLGTLLAMIIAIAILYAIFFAWLASQADFDSLADPGNLLGQFIIAALLMAILGGLIQTTYMLMTAGLLVDHHRGRKPNFDSAWQQTKRRLLPLFGVGVLVYIGVYIVFFVLALVLSQIHPAALVMLLPLYIWVWIKVGFLPVAAAATQRGESLIGASASVSAGDRFFPVLGRAILAILPVAGIYLVSMLLFLTETGGGAALGALLMLVGGLGAFLVYQSAMVKLYLDSGAPVS